LLPPDLEVDDNLIHDELHSLLLSLISKETKGKQRDYEIVTRYYGLDTEEPLSIKQLSRIYDISCERVRQIIANVTVKLSKPQNMKLLNEYKDI
jgi:DNA-directed RNA polymerase sigma subunit (sigma70/sigma32)